MFSADDEDEDGSDVVLAMVRRVVVVDVDWKRLLLALAMEALYNTGAKARA